MSDNTITDFHVLCDEKLTKLQIKRLIDTYEFKEVHKLSFFGFFFSFFSFFPLFVLEAGK
jgi:hypothetical protein